MEFKDGGGELRLEFSSLEEIKRWIPGWGGDATVVKPLELTAMVKKSAEKILNS